MNAAIKAQPGIMKIRLYEGGQSQIDGVPNVIKLSANENPFGCSEAAREAYLAAARSLHRYPSTDHSGLRRAIGEVHGLEPDRIICGVGSDEILQFLAQGFAGPGDEVIYTEHGFALYPILAHASGATPVMVAERERVVDVDAILAACTKRTRLVFIANPANPTGTMIGTAEMARLADGLPAGCLLVQDGAYAEFVEGFDGGAALAGSRDNVVMTRTFSKIHGLGGLRIGWGYGPKALIEVLNRLRQPFNLATTQLAAAEAAMRDNEWVKKCRSENTRMKAWLAEALAELGVPSDTSCTNFILARFADADEADAHDAFLRSRGIIVRRVAGYGLPNCLRITIGDEAACRQVVAAVRAFREVRG